MWYDKFSDVLDSLSNGQHQQAKNQIKRLSRVERFEMYEKMVEFEIAQCTIDTVLEMIIKGNKMNNFDMSSISSCGGYSMSNSKEQQKQDLIVKLKELGLNQSLFPTPDTVDEVLEHIQKFSGGEKTAAMVSTGMMFNALTFELAQKGLLNTTKEPLKAHEHLVDYVLAQELNISVFDGKEYGVIHSTDRKQILATVDSADESTIQVYASNHKLIGWADIILEGDEPETVVDYDVNPFMETWSKVWEKHHEKV
jgi:hypothetical protein